MVATYRAVIFDLGGVVFPSPLEVFRTYEREQGLPDRFISEVVLADPVDGAWSRLERGELTLATFPAEFEAECRAAGGEVDASALMLGIGSAFAPRPEMIGAILAIRDRGLRTGALTNNWIADEARGNGASSPALDGLFDVIVESAIVGLRKPDPRIYEMVCVSLDITPPEAVFLDDLGTNLKPARAMGMATIKVGDPHEAIDELGGVLGVNLA
ncbi:MAG: HAD-IA family hydrolase [Acidimicrobiia bacterium]